MEKIAKVFSVHGRFPVDLKSSTKFDLIRLVKLFNLILVQVCYEYCYVFLVVLNT